jgi:hypothetical protein
VTSADALLAEKVAAIERHLDRVAARLPADASALVPMSDASDAVMARVFRAATDGRRDLRAFLAALRDAG